jgi:uncharacterized membrane protein
MIYVTAFCVTFIAIFLKGFQFKNIQHNKWWSMFATSYVQGTFEFVAAGTYATIFMQGTWWYCFINGTAAAFSIVSATWIHQRWFHSEAATT